MRSSSTYPVLLCMSAFVGIGCGSDEATGPTTGDIRVSVTAVGPGINASGYAVVLDGTDSRTIPAGDQEVFRGIASGQHTVAIEDVGANCQLSGPASRTVTVVGGEEVVATFALSCDAIIAGAWYYESDIVLADSPCRITALLDISQSGSTFTGTAAQRRLTCPADGIDEPVEDALIVNGVVEQADVEFDFDDADVRHTGVLEEEGMTGSVTYQLNAGPVVGSWTAIDIGAIP